MSTGCFFLNYSQIIIIVGCDGLNAYVTDNFSDLEIHFCFLGMNFVKELIPPCGVLDYYNVAGLFRSMTHELIHLSDEMRLEDQFNEN